MVKFIYLNLTRMFFFLFVCFFMFYITPIMTAQSFILETEFCTEFMN